MKTREEILQEVLAIPNTNKLLQLSTGVGKSKLAIELINQIKPTGKILIVVPRLVLIQNWKDEFIKWNYEKYLPQVEFVTYVSLPKLMGNNYDINVMDECFKGDTEILTNSGYKQFQNLTETDLVAQWTDDGKIEFVPPIRLIKRWHSDKMCKLHLKRNRFLYVTPNHNQPYFNSHTNNIVTRTIQDLPKGATYKYITTGQGTGNNNLLTPIERVFIAIQANGTLQRHQKNESVYSIHLTRERKKSRFESLIKDLSGFTEISCKRPNTQRWMCKLPKGDAKLLGTHFTINMGYDRANDFINEIVQWDSSSFDNQLYYSSKIKENTDFVAAVAVQAGYQVFQAVEHDNRKESYSDIHRVYMRKPKYRFGDSSLNSATKEYIDYDDFVYCVEVPSHKIVIRSEGVTFISGNCHHISERCQQAIPYIHTKYNILLSATIKRTLKPILNKLFPQLYTYNISLTDAIENEILPEPRIVLIPLHLETTQPTELLEIKPKAKQQITISYDRWCKGKFQYYKTNANYGVKVKCTQQQKYTEICDYIESCNKKLRNNLVSGMNKIMVEQARKRKGLERLQWLAEIKSDFVKQLLKQLKNYRTLTFCYNIKQADYLCSNSIHSKNKNAKQVLDNFNSKKIKHISAIDCLTEGANLVDCKILVFAKLDASLIKQAQKQGRGLRHTKPVFLLPYYTNTKEEQIVNQMIADYDSSLIVRATNPFNFNEYINR